MILVALTVVLVSMLTTTDTFAGLGKVIVEDHPAAGVAKLWGNGTTIFYGEGTCADKCRFNQTITNPAYKALDQVPLPYVTGVYTKIKSGNGDYTVCFDTHLLNHPAIYQFSNGFWTLVTSAPFADQLCASASGNSVIGLFGVVTERTSPTTTTTTTTTTTSTTFN